MKPIFAAAKKAPKRIVYAEGEDERVLRAVQVVVDEGLAKPILIGRPAVLERRIERFGLRTQARRRTSRSSIRSSTTRYRDYWTELLPADASARASRSSTRRSRCAAGTR